ncbi:hypothetical protein TcasGA2_TC006064 [Tribolium castaneum]|uniref:Uncharacterized protein n=1 Tax=Tribolium castaneum TaxID=7070 RepID=D6WYN7_TRICA|nr:hypothetical protein TcasGA2_TC006064 [Tribolium castaneum]
MRNETAVTDADDAPAKLTHRVDTHYTGNKAKERKNSSTLD